MADTSHDPQGNETAEQVTKDCLLIVGPANLEVEVNSNFLSAASQPFRAMFSPEWREDRELNTKNGLLTMTLLDDDGVALKFICAVIHHENHTIPNDVPADTLLRIAIMANKYYCDGALRYASESWLSPAKNAIDDLSVLTAAAYLFNNASAFRRLTKQMILTYKAPFAAANWGEMEDMLNWKLLGGSHDTTNLFHH